jgi:hypothetical protein
MGIFGLMCLGNDIEILYINLYVFGSWVREKVSELEKVVEIKSYEGLSVFLDVVACLDGFTRCFRRFFWVGNIAHVFG